MRVAFDSRPATTVRGVGRYTRSLLAALRKTVPRDVEIIETHRPRRVDVFHSPWLEGAVLRSPCPMVVTLHDVDALTRLSERLRCGGVHLRLRHLALARATHVIVPTDAIADDAVTKLGLDRGRVVVIPEALDPAACGRPTSHASSWEDVARATWQVYMRALSEPARAFVSTPRAASIRS
jgi:glycosyltransferase involved in cell wall biosynthesis